ncbi:MAG: hypothetical protein OQJ84_10025, partial [Xanthomonadales bacterium]|nr:hypothetical protein [Xanthomonadales bacterium]
LEHKQMEDLLDEIAGAIEAEDTDRAIDVGDSLLLLVQQHNIKEEEMLYPAAENLLAGDWDELSRVLAEYKDLQD